MARGENRNKKCILLDEIVKKFLGSLRDLRKSFGMSCNELAEKLNISSFCVYDWEEGKCYPTLEKLIRLAEVFDYDISESLNYKYFYKINSSGIYTSMKRYGLNYRELERITGFKRHRVRGSILMNGRGTVSCLAAVLAVIDDERKRAKFRRSLA